MVTVQAQYKLEVNAPGTVDISDPYFQVKFTISAQTDGGISLPDIKGLELLAGPATSFYSSSTTINGKRSSSVSTTYTYTFRPLSKGTFHIPAASVKVRGKVYQSKSITIKVDGNASSRPQNPAPQKGNAPSPFPKAMRSTEEGDLYIDTELGKNEVYEQEAVPLCYRYYERPGVGLNSISLNKKPDFKNVVSQDIPIGNITTDITHVKGETFKTGIIQKNVLFPQQTGAIDIPSVTFNCIVLKQDETVDIIDAFFNNAGTFRTEVRRTAPGATLKVKPLPSPKPSDFSGGVGHFEIKGDLLNQSRAKTNELVTYRITISGDGNLKLLSAPSLTLPKEFDAYKPKSSEKTSVTLSGVSGNVSFDYTFVPREVGDFEIPEVHFVYFDLHEETYKTLTVPAIPLHVEKGSRNADDVARERALLDSDIRGLHKGDARFHSATDYYWWGKISYWVTLAAIILFFPLLFILLRLFVRRHGDEDRSRNKKAARTAVNRLKKAKESIEQDDKTFYAELSNALMAYLADKTGNAPADMNRENIKDILEEKGISDETVSEVNRILGQCELVRFAPSFAEGKPQDFYDATLQLITTIEHELSGGKRKKNGKSATGMKGSPSMDQSEKYL